jgi:hypothetical protein
MPRLAIKRAPKLIGNTIRFRRGHLCNLTSNL